MARKIPMKQIDTTSKVKKFVLEDSETGDLYDVFIKNGELTCEAQDEEVRRENRFKKLLDE